MNSDKVNISVNKKAKFDYIIEEVIEAGIALLGPEVKSLRMNSSPIGDSYIYILKNEAFITNLNIKEYDKKDGFKKHSKRKIKLLLNKKEINKLIGKTKIKGYSIIPLSIYNNSKNLIKMEIALAKGKKNYDKRHSIKEKEWNRKKERLYKER